MMRFISMCLAIMAASVTLGVLRWKRAEPAGAAQTFVIPTVAAPADSLSLETAESVLVARSGFHADARPVVLSVAAPLKPTLILRAVVGGPPWQAIVDGLPGAGSGTVVQAGARFGGVTVVSVARDSVRVRTADSAWTLSYRKSP